MTGDAMVQELFLVRPADCPRFGDLCLQDVPAASRRVGPGVFGALCLDPVFEVFQKPVASRCVCTEHRVLLKKSLSLFTWCACVCTWGGDTVQSLLFGNYSRCQCFVLAISMGFSGKQARLTGKMARKYNSHRLLQLLDELHTGESVLPVKTASAGKEGVLSNLLSSRFVIRRNRHCSQLAGVNAKQAAPTSAPICALAPGARSPLGRMKGRMRS
jgi:hypothetical protein